MKISGEAAMRMHAEIEAKRRDAERARAEAEQKEAEAFFNAAQEMNHLWDALCENAQERGFGTLDVHIIGEIDARAIGYPEDAKVLVDLREQQADESRGVVFERSGLIEITAFLTRREAARFLDPKDKRIHEWAPENDEPLEAVHVMDDEGGDGRVLGDEYTGGDNDDFSHDDVSGSGSYYSGTSSMESDGVKITVSKKLRILGEGEQMEIFLEDSNEGYPEASVHDRRSGVSTPIQEGMRLDLPRVTWIFKAMQTEAVRQAQQADPQVRFEDSLLLRSTGSSSSDSQGFEA